MIEPKSKLCISKQCELLNLSKSTYYYIPSIGDQSRKEEQKSFVGLVAAIYSKCPFYGYRKIDFELKKY